MHLFLDEILMKFINWLQKKNKPLKKNPIILCLKVRNVYQTQKSF